MVTRTTEENLELLVKMCIKDEGFFRENNNHLNYCLLSFLLVEPPCQYRNSKAITIPCNSENGTCYNYYYLCDYTRNGEKKEEKI